MGAHRDWRTMYAMRHLYVHIPFCAHRCGYCDFVTVTRSPELHERYVAAIEHEHALRAPDAGPGSYDTVFVGGGTPTLLEPRALSQLLQWVRGLAAPGAEVTIECNPETVDARLVEQLVSGGVNRVSLGAQSFQPHLLHVLERLATPHTIRRAVCLLRAGGVDNLSLDVIWGIPGQRDADVRADLSAVIALAPDHVSAYELDFKPGTRLTHTWGGAEVAVGDTSDDFYDTVVDTLTGAQYDWYETANFARPGRESRHNLGYWRQHDYVGVGIGAVSTVAGERRTNLPNIVRYMLALEGGCMPPARTELLDDDTRRRERIMLALRLGRPCELAPDDLELVVDLEALMRLEQGGLLERVATSATVSSGETARTTGATGTESIVLTRRGRMMLNYVLARVLT